ncbi:MAG: 2-oxoacid:ferredoxin oxidoreductase subunit beta, partial [Ignisphaera sp.]
LAIIAGYTFVARGYAFEGEHLKNLVKKAIAHRGAAFIDVLQPCITFNDVFTADYYRKRVYRLEDESSWNPVVEKPEEKNLKMLKAIEKSLVWDNRIPIGVFYEDRTVSTLEERFSQRLKIYPGINPSSSRISRDSGKPLIDNKDFEEIFKEYIVDVGSA